MQKTLITILIIAAIAVIGFVLFGKKKVETPAPVPAQPIVATFSDGVTSVEAAFDNEAGTVTFAHEATGAVTLPVAISASGARYANEDESIVFWEHQGEATITKDGEAVFVGTATQ